MPQEPSDHRPVWQESLAGLLDQVEERLGHPLEVRRMPRLEEPVSLESGDGPDPVHRILYRDSESVVTPYLVAMEATQLLRLLQVPPALRVEMRHRREARERVVNDTERRNRDLTLAQQRQLGLNLYGMTLSQLRTVPTALAVDRWLFERMAELRDRQEACLRQQCRELAESLTLGMDQRMPPLVLQANRAMDAAYALHAAALMGLPELAASFSGGPWEQTGRELLETADGIAVDTEAPADPDRLTVDAWATALGIDRWYRWVPAAGTAASA